MTYSIYEETCPSSSSTHSLEDLSHSLQDSDSDSDYKPPSKTQQDKSVAGDDSVRPEAAAAEIRGRSGRGVPPEVGAWAPQLQAAVRDNAH